MLEVNFSEAAQAHLGFYVERSILELGLEHPGDKMQLRHATKRMREHPDYFQDPTLKILAAQVIGEPNKFLHIGIVGRKGVHVFEFPGNQPGLIIKLIKNVEDGVIKPKTISIGSYN